MEEKPEDHDFDQRRDGPDQHPTDTHTAETEAAKEQPVEQSSFVQRPTVQIDTANLPRRRSADNLRSAPALREDGSTFPYSEDIERLPPARHSTQLVRNRNVSDQFDPPGRKSTQMSRIGRRTSRDFDVRRDGPYGRPSLNIGRPSLNLTRRKSSGYQGTQGTPGGLVDGQPATDGEGTATDKEDSSGDAEAPSLETLQSSDAAFHPEPPSVNYTLRTRKMSIVIFWALILIDSIAMPIGLYFGLHYGTTLSPNAVFSIVTAALGGVSILEYNLRFWRLWKKGSTCRVIGARRSYLDWFHWNFSLAWLVIVIELVVGTIPTNPPIRLLSMPLASICLVTGLELLAVDTLRLFKVPAPVRISSIPKGSQLRPGIYSVIEDVVAVDGSGGTEFREALNRRYEASHIFRAMLRRLGMFWALGFIGAGVLTTVLVFTLEHDPAYIIGWSLPFVWAGFWTLGTFWYVDMKLKEEKKAWAEEVAAKSQA